MAENSKGYKVVVVGSSNFDDKAFVFGFLDKLKNIWEKTGEKIDTLYSGSFSGVAKFAKEWALMQDVNYREHHFFADEKDNPMFGQIDIPDFVVKNDDFFQKGKDFFLQEGIGMLVLMPNAEGELGVSTTNILRMAESAGMGLGNGGILNGQDFYQHILNARNKQINEQNNKSQEKVTKLSSLDKF